MSRYTKDGKIGWDDTSKNKHPPTKTIDDVTGGKESSSEKYEVHKRKCQYIASITGGALRANAFSKW